VELPQLQNEKILEALEEIGTRLNATMKAWPETRRTLEPALKRLLEVESKHEDLHENLRFLWHQGFARKWKV